MTSLLISVRSIAEAAACLHNGADRIDVKDPSRGSLGMASQETIRAILREVPPRIPVSAALGEWMEWRQEGRFPPVPAGVSHVKIGLAGAGGLDGWREELGRFARETIARTEIYCEPEWVAVAYADWRLARSPQPDEVLDFASANGFPVLLLDTYVKDGTSLFDVLGHATVARLADAARARGLQVGLAGSIRRDELPAVLALAPDVVAIRSAACGGADRAGAIDGEAVRLIAAAFAAARQPVLGSSLQ